MVGVVTLIEGWDPVANTAVYLYAASHDDPAVCHLNGWTWWPAIAKLPTLRYDLFDGAFAGQITAPSSTLTMRTEPWPNFARYKLADARIRVWTGPVGEPWANWALRFDGRLTGQPIIQDGSAEIAFAVDDRWLDTALLPTYAGTTGAEGPAALKGQIKPLAIGAPRYVAGTLIDSVNSVFQVSAFAVNGFEAALDKLSRFGAPQGDYGSYATLIAATLPPGAWATAKSIGLARFGAPPTGQVSFLLQGDSAGPDGWVRVPGRVVRRIALLAGGAGKIDDASLAALDAARPYNVSIYADQQTTARELIQSLAASLNCVAGVSWTGQLFVAPVGIGVADVTLAADGSALPPVGSVQQLDQASPFQKLAMTAERTWTVHALGDIAFTATLIDVGTYAAGTTYREGNVVSLADGSRYLYVSTTPAAGNAPPNATYWSQLAAASIVDFANVSGATRPEANATLGATLGANGGGNIKKAAGGLWLEPDLNTAVGIAAAVTGQGPGATAAGSTVLNSYLQILSNGTLQGGGGGQVTYGGIGGGALGLLASLFYGSPYLLESNGGPAATLANFKTALGVASSIAGQGSFATISSVGYGSPLLTGFAALATLASLSFGSSYLLESTGGPSATLGNFKTSSGISSGFAGQGLLATRNAVSFASGEVTERFASNLFYGDSSALTGSVQSLRPAELGSNVTETRTAAAFTGQAWAATNGTQTRTDNQLVPTGSNGVVNSGFKRGAYGFTSTNTGGFSSGINLNSDYTGLRQVPFTGYSGTLAAGVTQDCWTTLCPWTGGGLAGATVDQMRKFCMPVAAGDRVYGRLLAARHRCNFQLYALFFNKDGGSVTGPLLGSTARSGGALNGNPANFDVCGSYVDVTDSTIAYMALLVRMVGTGEPSPYVFWTEPQMGKLAPGQTALPPYADGPNDPVADQTGANTAAAFIGQGSFATLSNLNRANIGSYFNYNALSLGYSITRSDGTTTVTEAIAITSLGISGGFAGQGALATQNTVTGDQVVTGAIKNADSSVVWDLNDASGRRRINKNGFRLVEGSAFGTNSDLIQWYGPTSVAYGSETKVNGVFALATDGKVYHGAAELSTGSASAEQTAGYGQQITKSLDPGERVTFDASIYVDIGGSSNGTVKCQLKGGPAGSAATVLAEGPGVLVAPGEPGGDTVTGSYQNSSGSKQVFNFYVDLARTPSTAGGAVRQSQSYLIM